MLSTVYNAWFRNWGLISPSLPSEKAVLSLPEDWVLGLGSVLVTSSLETCFLESSHLGQLSEISPFCLPHPYNLSLEHHSFVPSPYCVHHIPTSFDRCPFTFLERITCLSPSLGSPFHFCYCSEKQLQKNVMSVTGSHHCKHDWRLFF